MEPLLNADEVAKLLKISKRTLESMIARGDGPPLITIGRQRRWRLCDLEEWLVNRTHSTPTVNSKGKECTMD